MRWLALLSLFASQAALADTLSGTVVKVLDGDTLVIADAAKKRHTVRLAGIDAPERNQPFWLEARRSLAALCHRKSATVEWPSATDRGRTSGKAGAMGKARTAEQPGAGRPWRRRRRRSPPPPS